jgi:alginate O-acetyltransferase complex protein AlgJ
LQPASLIVGAFSFKSCLPSQLTHGRTAASQRAPGEGVVQKLRDFRGDLLDLKHAPANQEERLKTRQVSDSSNAALQPNAASSILILGDSHTLVFHDFLAERAGFTDQLAHETGVVPDWIGTRGSGANAVRISLLRRAIKDAGYLASKKAVVWCFAAREFTEADQGWQRLPLTAPGSSK